MVCTPILQIAVNGKGFNHSARDAWELFQSTGVEALVAYDCSGAVLLMGTLLGGLVTGTCSGIWTWIKWRDRVSMVGSTTMLMGMVLVSFFHKNSIPFCCHMVAEISSCLKDLVLILGLEVIHAPQLF